MVSTPIEWDELTDDLDPREFTIETAPDRFAEVGDIWNAADEKEKLAARARLARADRSQRELTFLSGRSSWSVFSPCSCRGGFANVGSRGLIHHVRELVVQVERVHGCDEALASGARYRDGLLADAPRQVLSHGMCQEPADFRGVSRQQCSAQAVQVCEQWFSEA